jgi:hypothetical protein
MGEGKKKLTLPPPLAAVCPDIEDVNKWVAAQKCRVTVSFARSTPCAKELGGGSAVVRAPAKFSSSSAKTPCTVDNMLAVELDILAPYSRTSTATVEAKESNPSNTDVPV